MTGKRIAIIGGTGKLGHGIAKRLSKFGHEVIIGSRTKSKALSTACSINSKLKNKVVIGLQNEDAASEGSIVILTVPFSEHRKMLLLISGYLTGKILIDATVPLNLSRVSVVSIPNEGSAAMQAQTLLGEDTKVVSAFQNVAAELLQSETNIDCDVLVTGNDIQSCEEVVKLINEIGMRGIHAGPLENASVAESLTSSLIYINKKYKIKHAGIRITGIDSSELIRK